MDRENQKIKLKDGRILGFAEYGDPIGKPLFYLHGWPASHVSAKKYDDLAKKMHIRIIAPDRPGFYKSDFQNGRTLLDWPDDVLALANHLNIKKFPVMGVSGGGPYAAACAYKIPNRLTKAGIVVGLGPTYIPGVLEGSHWLGKLGWQTYHYGVIRAFAAFSQLLVARYGSLIGIHGFLFPAKSDRKVYAADRQVRDGTTQCMREAYRQGSKGPAYDLKLYTSPWGFDVSHIRTKTYLFYGSDDENAPIAMGKYYASHIPGNTFTVYPGEGHLISVTHAAKIFKTLVS